MPINSRKAQPPSWPRAVCCAVFFICALLLFVCLFAMPVSAGDLLPSEISLPNQLNDAVGELTGMPGTTTSTMQMLFLVVLLALAPSILIVMTCFTRIIIVLHFLRSALGTQQMPPNQVLIGLALFLTIFNMSPIFAEINERALQPLSRQEMTQNEAVSVALEPIRDFMFKQVTMNDLNLFSSLSGETYAGETDAEIRADMHENMPTSVLIPAFVLGEVVKGFQIGFIIFIPFIVIDMVVASTLMAMGMMMLPPAMISLPFKILLFVMVDGWSLVISSLMQTFRG